MVVWFLALGTGALLGGYAIQRVLREQLALQPLSYPTVIVVWALYTWLTALPPPERGSFVLWTIVVGSGSSSPPTTSSSRLSSSSWRLRAEGNRNRAR